MNQQSISILEAYPDKIEVLLEKRDRHLRLALPPYINGNAFELVMTDAKLWRIGVLKVSFKGGYTGLHGKIAKVAGLWSHYGDIKFDFGYNEVTGEYRKWWSGDDSHIRVGFEYRDYWSLVGTDSADPNIVTNGEITLNLSNFDHALPRDWEGTVLHEFGHALGFEHEHQAPEAPCDFDWEKVYKELAGPPNNWSKEKVDHNFKKLSSDGRTWSEFDPNSIMIYALEPWMFLSGAQSPCYTQRGNTLSNSDKSMMAEAYPEDKEKAERIIDNRINNLNTIVANKNLDKISFARFDRQLRFLRKMKI
jgi:hypothetical protein